MIKNLLFLIGLALKIPAMNKKLSIGDAAKMLGVSINTLRNWDISGKLSPIRTSGGQRRYKQEDLEVLVAKPHVVISNSREAGSSSAGQSPVINQQSTSPVRFGEVFNFLRSLAMPFTSIVAATLVVAGIIFINKPSSIDFAKGKLAEAGFHFAQSWGPKPVTFAANVLAAETTTPDYRFLINVPAIFSKNITAPNVIYGLVAGDNITVSAGQNPTISSVLPDQFKTFKVGSTSITAGSKTDTLELVAGSNVTLSTSDKKITIANSYSAPDTGWTLSGGISSTTKLASIGAASGAARLNLNVDDNTDLFTASKSGNLVTKLNSNGILTTTGVLPLAHNAYDLGSSTAQWNKLYVDTIYANNGIISWLQRNSGTVAPTNITDDFLIGGIATASAAFRVSSAGVISAGTWNGVKISETYGGTNQSTYTTGDILYSSATNTLAKLGVGSANQILVVSGGVPTWTSNPGGSGSGTFGYWSRSGTNLTPVNSGDTLTLANSNTLTGQAGNLQFSQGISVGGGTTYYVNTSGNANFNTLNAAGTTLGATTVTSFTDSGSASVSGALTLYGTPTIATTAKQSLTLGDSNSGNVVVTNNLSAANLSGTNTGDQTITLTGDVTGSGTGSFATTIGALKVTNAMLAGSISPSKLLTVSEGYGGTNQTTYTTGDILYSSATNTLTKLGIGSANQVLSVVAGIPGWVASGAVGTNYWNISSGALFPLSSTADLLVGGQSTASAKFAFINVNSGTPTASVSGNLVLDAAGVISTTKKQTLTIGDANTGNIAFGQTITSGTWNGTAIGAIYGGTGQTTWTTGDLPYSSATNTISKLTVGSTNQVLIVSGGVPSWGSVPGSSCVGCILNDPGGTQTITPTVSTGTGLRVAQAASGSVDVFSVTNNGSTIKYLAIDSSGNATASGNLTFDSAVTLQTSKNQTLTLGGNTTGNITLSPLAGITGAYIAPSTNNQVDLGTSSLNFRNIYATTLVPSGTSGVYAWWQRNSQALSPANITDDFLVGGIATSSAKFQIFGLTGNASTSGNLIFSSSPTLGTTAKQSLTLGDTNTGNVVLANPTTFNSTFTLPNSNTITGVSGYTQFGAGLSVGGGTTYYINNLGTASLNAVTVNSTLAVTGATTLTGALIANSTASVSGALTLFGTSTIASTALQTLFLGGTTTGNIQLSPGSATPTFVVTTAGNIGIGTTAPTNILSLGNAAARKFWIENTATDVVGRALTIASGGTIAGTSVSDVTGGNLILQSGLGTGTGESTISFQTGTTLGTGLTLQTMSTKMTILGSGNVGIGTTSPGAKLDVTDTSNTAASLSLTNNTATTIGNGANTLGVLDLQSTSLTTGNFLNLETNALTTGKSLNLASTSNAYSTGNLFNAAITQTAATGTAVSGNIAAISFSPTYSTAITTPAISGNVLNLSRSSIVNTDFASTLTVSGAVLAVSDSATQTQGTLTSTADVMQISQNYSSNSGSALNITTAGSGFALRVNDNGTLTDTTPFVVDGTGNVGIGTTTPLAKLHVEGACLTADTLIKRKRKKRKGSFDDAQDWEDVPITDIETGDEVLTLDERTGQFVVSKVRQMMNMGVKEVFELMTESGKVIKTTDKHPYLVDFASKEKNPDFIQKETYEYSEQLAKDYYISKLAGNKIRSKSLGQDIVFTHTGWNHFVERSRSLNELITRFFALTRVVGVIKNATKVTHYEERKKTDITIEYWVLEQIIEFVLVRVVISSVNKGPKFFLSCIWKSEQKERGIILGNKKELSLSAMPRRRELVIPQLFSKLIIPPCVKWIKVKDLSMGARIATIDGWERIISIKKLDEQYVYDLEIENTHNFVANGIVAHNTYLNGTASVSGALTLFGTPTIASTALQTLFLGGTTTGNIQLSPGSATPSFVVTTAGQVGIGTTSPTSKLHVEGACVIAGTKIRRRRRKKNGEWEEEDIAIEDIKPGDQVLTLEEKSLSFIWQSVRQSMNMGVQPVLELQTITGKRIQTTARHPFLILAGLDITYGTFEVDLSIHPEHLGKPTIVGFSLGKTAFTIKIHQQTKKALLERYQKANRPHLFGPFVYAQAIAACFQAANIYPSKLIIDTDYTGFNKPIQVIISQFLPETEVVFAPIGKHSMAHLAVWEVNIGKRNCDAVGEIKESQGSLPILRAVSPGVDTEIRRPHDFQLMPFYSSSSELSRARWTKVGQIKVGQYLATVDGWEKIVAIREISRKQVYDLEIENTHNFVANGIVAHNTYLNGTASVSGALTLYGTPTIASTALQTLFLGGTTTGNIQLSPGSATPSFVVTTAGQVGIGTTTPVGKLEVSGAVTGKALGIFNETGDQNILVASASGTNRFVITNAGNVGIGTTGPGEKLEIGDGGNLKLSGGNASGEGNIILGAAVSGFYDANLLKLTSTAGTLGFLAGTANAFTGGNGPYFGARGNDYVTFADQQGILFFAAGNQGGFSAAEGTIRFTSGADLTRMVIGNSGQIGMGGSITNAGTLAGASVVIDTSGNVGIGTTSPLAKLDVNGTASVSGALTLYGTPTIGTLAMQSLVLGNSTTGGVSLAPGGTTVLTAIQGNVGIGTTSPVGKLEVSGAVVGKALGIFNETGDQNILVASASGTNRFVITNAGNVGIGTTGPGALLDVNGASIFRGNMTFVADNSHIIGGDGANRPYGLRVATDINIGAGTHLASTTNSYFGGNLGIGTTSPLAKLDVNGTASISGALSLYGTPTIGTLAMQSLVLGNSTTGGVSLAPGGTTVLTAIQGNVGIGTTGPLVKLQVGANVNTMPTNTSLFLRGVGGGAQSSTVPDGRITLAVDTNADYGGYIGNLNIDGTGTGQVLVLGTRGAGADSPAIYLRTGNVGIGTTAPGVKLAVVGDIQSTTKLLLGTATNGTTGQFATDGTNSFLDYPGTLSIRPSVAQSGGVTILSSGNVGIGTTGPKSNLDVNGIGFRRNDVNDMQVLFNLYYEGGWKYTGTGTGNLLHQDTDGLNIFSAPSGTAGTSASITRRFLVDNSGNLGLGGAISDSAFSGASMVIKSGNVGIGTTSPLAKLHVEGNCVTGDTLLPIRRRKKKKLSDADDLEDDHDYFLCRIDQIMPDDQVLSLDEATQELRYARINKRMDMGIQDIFELTTKSGRKIRVTANHPFLVQKV